MAVQFKNPPHAQATDPWSSSVVVPWPNKSKSWRNLTTKSRDASCCFNSRQPACNGTKVFLGNDVRKYFLIATKQHAYADY
jgi:hypothetical protein